MKYRDDRSLPKLNNEYGISDKEESDEEVKEKNEKVDSDYEPKEDESDNDKDKIDH